MSFNRETFCEKHKSLRLVGSQINLTPRSDNSVIGSLCSKSCTGVYSPVASSRAHSHSNPKCVRPKSADCGNVCISRCNSTLQWPLNPNRKKKSDDSLLTVSQFTDSSSKLLQNLLETSKCRTSCVDERVSPDEAKSENPIPKKYIESKHSREFSKTGSPRIDSAVQVSFSKDSVKGSFNQKAEECQCSELFSEASEEKTVRFLDCQNLLEELPEKKFSNETNCTHFNVRDISYPCPKSEKMFISQEKRTRSNAKRKEQEVETLGTVQSENDFAKFLHSDCEDDAMTQKGQKEGEINFKEDLNLQNESESEEHGEGLAPAISLVKLASSHEELCADNKALRETQRLKQGSTNEEILTEPSKHEKIHENPNDGQKINLSDSTYEEIVNLLQTLEDEDSESLNTKNKEDSSVDIPMAGTSPEEKVDYFGVMSSFLQEVELQDMDTQENCISAQKWNSDGFSSPRLEELLNKNSVELAHEVFSLKIQVEDQKKGIKLLKETLAEMKEARKSLEAEHNEALRKVNADAEILVQRHQKFIKQLLSEKNNLNETVSKLVKDLKTGEEKYKRNMKAIEEKHAIEIKRAKETQAVADKIKREKWMEIKTQKIKEMTVKGLEPELSRLAARQQEEMTELRNLHKAEIEAIELRAARRSSDLMDELRAELTKEKERAVAKETASVRAAMEKEFDEERNRLQKYSQTLKDNIRKQEDKLSTQEQEFKQRLADVKQEEEKKRLKIMRDHEENVEEIRRQHLIELRNLRESLEAEKEVFINNYKKKQVAKFFEREAELHQQYKRERDREIELIIETLENEAAQIQSELTLAGESKLKRFKEKMEAELKEIEGSEAALKIKLSETKSKLSEKEEQLTELNSQIRQLETELTFFKRSCEEMSSQKTKMKEIIRAEFESSIAEIAKENEKLEKEMAACKEQHVKELAKKDQINVQTKHEMQKELTRVYSRIKTAVSKKEKIIESLRQENTAINQRCHQLELMLDQQRRNLLL